MREEFLFKKLKKSVLLFLTLFFLNSILYAQSYLPYIATVYDTAASTGYYFFSPKLFHPAITGNKDANMILDKYGEVIYYKMFPAGKRAADFKLQPNGMMTYSDQYQFFIMDSTFTLIDSIKVKNGLVFDGHEFQILPNGHFL